MSLHEIQQEEIVRQAERQGVIVYQVTGKMACTLMSERAELLGYLSVLAKENEQIARYLKSFE